MGSGFVVILPPLLDLLACVSQTAKSDLVQTFIAEAAVETLHIAILQRSSGLNRVPLQTLFVGPLINLRRWRLVNPCEASISITGGDTATMRFWHKNRQAAIDAVNGSSSSTALGNCWPETSLICMDRKVRLI